MIKILRTYYLSPLFALLTESYYLVYTFERLDSQATAQQKLFMAQFLQNPFSEWFITGILLAYFFAFYVSFYVFFGFVFAIWKHYAKKNHLRMRTDSP